MTDAIRTEILTRNLLNYFAAVAGRQGHVFELRDINLQVMMNVFAANERLLLDGALDGLVAGGVLLRVSPTGWSLTDLGLAGANTLRPTHGLSAPAARVESNEDAVAHGLPPTRGRRIPVTR